MSDTLRDLLTNGFMIYPSNGVFILRKEPVPSSPFRVEERTFPSYTEAVEEAERILTAPQITEWTVLVRYNRGLGIEYKQLDAVFAYEKLDADDQAALQVEKFAKEHGARVSEIRVRPKI